MEPQQNSEEKEGEGVESNNLMLFTLSLSVVDKTMTSRRDYFHSATTIKLKRLGGQEWGEVRGRGWRWMGGN